MVKIYKNRFGFSVHSKIWLFSMDINEWYFLPSIVFKNFDCYILIIGFLCFHLLILKRKEHEDGDKNN